MSDRSRSPLTFKFVFATLVAFAAFAVAFAPPASAGVIVVALDGSGDTNSVDTAITLAAPGDLILVRAGNYISLTHFDPEAFYDIDKPLTIVGDGAGASIGMVRVRDILPGKEVVFRNLTFTGPLLGALQFEKIGVQNCLGTVIFEDCKAFGVTGTSPVSPGLEAVEVKNSAAVTFTRCTLRGGAGNAPTAPFIVDAGPGGTAVLVTNSKVALHHCTVNGGWAGNDTVAPVVSKPGGDAMQIGDPSTIFVAGGSITGGEGNDGGDPAFPELAAGGDGLVVDGFSLVRLVGITPAGGAGGTLGDASSAPSGEAQVVTVSTVETYGETARGTTMPGLLNEGEAGTLGISGSPGELGKIMVGIDLVHAQLGGKKGVFNLGGTFFGPIVLGTIPPSGLLEVPVSFPRGTLLGLEGLRLDFQGLTFGAEGLMFGNPSSTVLLGPGF